MLTQPYSTKTGILTPIIIGGTSGIYPLVYNYYSNFTLVDSSSQFLFFISYFILFPVVISILAWVLAKYNKRIQKYYQQIRSCIHVMWFTCLILYSVYGFQKSYLLLGMILAFGVGLLVHKQLKKVVVFQILLFVITSVMLLVHCINDINFSTSWQKLPDTITQAQFVNKPNIYIIQPDGYVNSSVLPKAPYIVDNSVFENFLKDEDFKIYSNFRSNYTNTVTSNSAMFAMKHHYYKAPTQKTNEPQGLRSSIAGNNAVLKTLNNNAYTSSLLLEVPYLIINRPEIAYNYCNIRYENLSFLSRGFEHSIDLFSELENVMQQANKTPQFYFIEKMLPRHIAVQAKQSKGIEKEREAYIANITEVNTWLTKTVTYINKNDPSALIVIIADHGGFVGMHCTADRRSKITDPAIINSMFSSFLAIKWPNGNIPAFDTALKTNTNLFRVLFSYLSQNETYLNHLEDDGSYVIVNKDVPHNVYRVLDNTGDIDFTPKN